MSVKENLSCVGVSRSSVLLLTLRAFGGQQDRSGRGGASIRFNEMRWDEITVSRCNLYESGRIASFWNTGIGDDMTGYEPRYADPQAGDYRQAPDSPLAGRATDGTNVGIN